MKNIQDKVFKIVLSTLVGITFVLSLVSLIITVNNKNNTKTEETKYTLYVGTNDKDTYKPVYEFDVCKEKVTTICVKYTSGCTVSEATGYWTDDDNNITLERTVVVILEDITLETVHKICDDIIKELNQNSILVETNSITKEFYSLA